jgi:hypothetical protein
MVWVPQAHAYMRTRGLWPPGKGVLIGVFDSGFWLSHRCFNWINDSSSVIAKRDFVDRDNVTSDATHFSGNSEEHGSWVTGILGGYDPGAYLGIAWGAQFALARTELDSTENPSEEENWAEAMVWAESLGVDIVNSSLGYRYDFNSIPDYPYEQMDGKATIISRAAQKASEFGVIVVNAMGNEHNMHYVNDAFDTLSISAPADAEGVVSVGAVNPDSTNFSRSSRGPTADGRIKPDLVAQGTDVSLPDIYSADKDMYLINSGTSFSTPIVAGICALLKQTFPGDNADRIKQRLYSSCVLLPWQDSVDNTAGRGLPNALRACLKDNEVLITVEDRILGTIVAGAGIFGDDGTQVGESDSSGIFIFNVSPSQVPLKIIVAAQGFGPETLTVNAAPAAYSVDLHHKYLIRAGIVNSAGGSAVETASISQIGGNDTTTFQRIVRDGELYVVIPDTGAYRLLLRAEACKSKDTIISVNSSITKILVTLELNAGVKITVRTAFDNRYIINAMIIAYNDNGELLDSVIDANGDGKEVMYFPDTFPHRVSVLARGYVRKDTIAAASAVTGEMTVYLIPAASSNFLLFPTVLRNGHVLSVEFVAEDDRAKENWQRARAVIRSADGAVVWNSILTATAFRSAQFRWDGKNAAGRDVVPGVYYFVLQYAEKTAVKKFMVVP